ncbi:MAG: hypothetical protein K8W52_30505 [Deltaproteobacteria bacterium]|nr:hypothetical protein [Deltaproteobacteria bacterium]
MKSTTLLASLAAAATLVLAIPSSRADGFGEVVVGIANPIGDDDYDNAVDTSFKLGVRAGELGKNGLGFEGAFDWTPISDNYGGSVLGQSIDVSWQRFRIQGGLRFGKLMGHNLMVFGRALAGVDLIHTSVSATVLGQTSSDSDTDAGLALEFGGGILVNAGPVVLGGQLAVPFGFHFDDSNSDNVDRSYTAIDLDVLFTASTAF